MTVALTPSLLALLTLVVLTAGVVNGLAGFGFAVVGTMALATVLPPATAVVLMILPILAANVTLVSELSRAELAHCARHFAPLVVAALVGTIAGMAVLDILPEAPVRVGLGLITLGFVFSRQQALSLGSLVSASPGDTTSAGDLTASDPADGIPADGIPADGNPPEDDVAPGDPFDSDPADGAPAEGDVALGDMNRTARERPLVMLVVGAVSGLLFGATNVGIQLVAYLRSLDLPHGRFVGVVAMVFVGINAVRVGAAGALGLYPSLTVFGLSLASVVPAVAGVIAGRWLRGRLSSGLRRRLVLGLLTIIGIRLVLGGLGIA